MKEFWAAPPARAVAETEPPKWYRLGVNYVGMVLFWRLSQWGLRRKTVLSISAQVLIESKWDKPCFTRDGLSLQRLLRYLFIVFFLVLERRRLYSQSLVEHHIGETVQ